MPSASPRVMRLLVQVWVFVCVLLALAVPVQGAVPEQALLRHEIVTRTSALIDKAASASTPSIALGAGRAGGSCGPAIRQLGLLARTPTEGHSDPDTRSRPADRVGVEFALRGTGNGSSLTGARCGYDPASTPTTPFHFVATNTALQFADDGARGFGSMSSFRRAYGSAGPNAQWHHVVEQTPGNVTQFGATSIHNTSNIVRIDTAIHRQVSGYYSSVQPFTGGQTVRQWLSSQPFDAQTQFGLDVLKQFGAAG